jgi:uncharacterized PurR-regulated membrane protein YhhQ (DUF165 family)
LSRQRYAPPGAEVKDVEHERALAQRPRQVAAAVVLLWAGFALGVPFMAFEYTHATASAPAAGVVVIVVFAVMLIISAVFNILIVQGRNWARIGYLLLTL